MCGCVCIFLFASTVLSVCVPVCVARVWIPHAWRYIWYVLQGTQKRGLELQGTLRDGQEGGKTFPAPSTKITLVYARVRPENEMISAGLLACHKNLESGHSKGSTCMVEHGNGQPRQAYDKGSRQASCVNGTLLLHALEEQNSRSPRNNERPVVATPGDEKRKKDVRNRQNKKIIQVHTIEGKLFRLLNHRSRAI